MLRNENASGKGKASRFYANIKQQQQQHENEKKKN